MNLKILVILFVFIFFISLASANGLQIVGDDHFEINKTTEIEKKITFEIENQEPTNFSNVQFESNPYISMDPVNISSGDTEEVTADVIATDDFSGVIKIKGFYESDLGEQEETHEVDVNYSDEGNELSRCDFSIIKGDTIKWNNLLQTSLGKIKLINADTEQEVAEIQPNSSYPETFDDPIEFSYYFTRYGIAFTNICTISVLDTSGLINNPEYDTQIFLDIEIIYEPTTISVTIPTTEYEIEAGDSAQDLLSIRNNGGYEAKNVKLTSDWFVFSSNNFDLDSGKSKNIGYTIKPEITATNQTNKTYTKKLKIEGNFETYEEEFEIFVPYMEIDEDFLKDSKTLEELFLERWEFVKAYCNDNPNAEDCNALLDALEEVAKSFSGNETLKGSEFEKAMIDFMDVWYEGNNIEKQKTQTIEDGINEIFERFNQSEKDTDRIIEKIDSINSGNSMIGMSIVFGVITFVLYSMYENNKKNKLIEQGSKYY